MTTHSNVIDTTKERTITIEVMRYRPDSDVAPWPQRFEIQWTHDMSILDALNLIKDTQEPELSYRWSCRMEVCGSCGMVINGMPKLACSTFVREYATEKVITVAALDNFPIEKDLVVDVDPFIRKLESIKPYIVKQQERALSEKEHIQTPKQLAKFKNYTMCINCMLCYQACPQVALNPDFLGPAAIALATRYNLDNRDQGSALRNPVLYQENGAWPCTFVGFCSVVCPKHVDPAASIQQTKSKGLMYFAGILPDNGASATEISETHSKEGA